MITLRNFNEGDLEFLMSHYKSGMTTHETAALLAEWNQKSFRGTYFEMFAIIHNAIPTGWISLFAHDKTTISAGMEVIESARGNGLATAALVQALDYAKHLGYTTAVAQIRKNNTASLRLHEKCGFIITGECLTSKGSAAFLLQRKL